MRLRRSSRNVAPLAVILLAIWCGLVEARSPETVALGAALALAIAACVARLTPLWSEIRLSPGRFVGFACYSAAFIVELVKSNVALLRQVYALRLDITPAVVLTPVMLRSRLGRLTLSNAVALTPGTLVLDMQGDMMRVHVLDARAGGDAETAQRVTAPFARHLEKAFG